ncbi:hypothetical protein [Undibacterium sp. TS12]|nr:hypothetical protein [Undibacterium sp. TS12]
MRQTLTQFAAGINALLVTTVTDRDKHLSVVLIEDTIIREQSSP